ncbi:MAG: hypothetical protein A2284_12295 [Deltaproteobacteria bacterium RIFOXYA12_FULL_61_11]|nr:MAG: hypothetical protein A2284_12295 [Deltaproteobacteria bacterium RIFOXYA12_FULL_61_11]
MWFLQFFSSSIGKKFVMALTGVMMLSFLAVHLGGNLLLFAGAEAYNSYSHTLLGLPFIVPVEVLFLAVFLLHLGLALTLTQENRRARPVPYQVRQNQGKPSRRTLASQSMIYSGALIFSFVALHVATMKYGPERPFGTTAMRDVHGLVHETFSNPLFAGAYIVAMLVLGVHLSHAFESALQTLGLEHPRYNGILQALTKGFTVIVTIGFSLLPVWSFVLGGR